MIGGTRNRLIGLHGHHACAVVFNLVSRFRQLMEFFATAGVNGAPPTVTLPTPAADTSATGNVNSQAPPTDLNPAPGSGTGTVDNSGNINAPAPPTGVHLPSVSFISLLLAALPCNGVGSVNVSTGLTKEPAPDQLPPSGRHAELRLICVAVSMQATSHPRPRRSTPTFPAPALWPPTREWPPVTAPATRALSPTPRSCPAAPAAAVATTGTAMAPETWAPGTATTMGTSTSEATMGTRMVSATADPTMATTMASAMWAAATGTGTATRTPASRRSSLRRALAEARPLEQALPAAPQPLLAQTLLQLAQQPARHQVASHLKSPQDGHKLLSAHVAVSLQACFSSASLAHSSPSCRCLGFRHFTAALGCAEPRCAC